MTPEQVPTTVARRQATRTDGLRLVAGMLALMWVVQVINSIDSQRLDSEGIVPRHLHGLIGIVLAPFLHAGFGHLIANTVPFALLGAMIALGGVARVLAVTAIVALVAGLGTWLAAPSGSVTLGASGVVFGFATFLVARGLFSRRLIELALAVLVAVLFGGVLLLGLVPHAGISWQDHLFGGLGGVLAARLLTEKRTRRASGRRLAGPTGTRA